MEKQKKTELQIILVELNQVVETTKIELSKAEGHALAFAPSMKLYVTLADEIKGLNKLDPSENDAKKAREARLKMVKVRTGAEEIKDLRKEGIRAEGDLIQALFNVVKNSCLVTENEFTEIEKHQERIEAKRQSDLAETRTAQLAQYGTDTTYLPLGIMTEEQFTRLLENEQLASTARKEAAEKAELARVEAERLAEEQRLAAIEKDRIEREEQAKENERLRKENEAKEALLVKERAEAKATADKLAKENEAKLAEQRKQSEIEAKKQADELAKQKVATDKAQAELRAKEAEEEKQRKIFEAQAKANEERETAALRAPDKDKVRVLFEAIKAIQIPEFGTLEGKALGSMVMGALKVLQVDIITESKKLL